VFALADIRLPAMPTITTATTVTAATTVIVIIVIIKNSLRIVDKLVSVNLFFNAVADKNLVILLA